MTAPRKPAAFRIEPETPPRQTAPEPRPQADAQRKPRAMKTDVAMVLPAEVDVFDEPDIIA
ncbi:TIGR01620 family protein, partial [Mesorhizobium sp. M7A.F.Ca.CA.004.12.1.1]